MKAKEHVRLIHPEALAWHWADGWCIYPKRTDNHGGSIGGSGWGSPARAWRAAWRELMGLPDPKRSQANTEGK